MHPLEVRGQPEHQDQRLPRSGFSNLTVHMNPLGNHCIKLIQIQSSRMEPEYHICNRVPRDDEAAGPWTTLELVTV